MKNFIAVLAVHSALAVLTTGANAALAINDATFDGGTFTEANTTFTNTDNAFNQWVVYGDTYDSNNRNFTMPASGGNPTGYADLTLGNSTSYRRAMYQAVTDNKASTGTNTFSFDLNLLDASTSSSFGLNVAIWGILDSSSAFSFSTIGTAVFDVDVGPAILLGAATCSTDTGGWQTQTIPGLDLGAGYDIIVIGFKGNNYSELDTVGIDNVSLAAIPEPSSFILVVPGLIFGWSMMRRRAA